ncbi:MAG TPA: hypothetical protein PLW13_07200 [Pseudomonadales bacterium]|nr:hypothetical protein [Pseudomonadales bacterium]
MYFEPVLNPASLNIVRPELSRLLRQAQADFALATQPASEGQGLDACVAALQQADGVLRLLELTDAAQLARELAAVIGASPVADAVACDAVSRALHVLARYPDYLAGCTHAVPQVLLEDINAMRALQSLPEFPETCFLPQCRASACQCPVLQPAGVAQVLDEGLPRRLRHLYQVGLLGVIRGHTDPVHLRLMQRAAERMLGLTGGGAAGEYWWLLGGVLEGFAGGALLPGRSRLRALSRADAMFRDYLRHPERRDEPVSPELREEMLGLVARAGEGMRASDIRARTGMGAVALGDAQLEEERARLLGVSTEALDAMVTAVGAEFRATREALEELAAHGEVRAAALDGVRDALARVQERLQAGGLRGAALLLAREMDTLDTRRADGAALGKDELLNLADAIVQTEASLGAFVRSQRGAGAQRSAAALAAPAAARDIADEAQLMLLRSARDCLDAVKRDVNAYVDSRYDVQTLASSTAQLNAVRGALLMLEHPRAAAIAAGMIDALGRGSPEHAAGVHERIAEVLADVLICLEYYLAALENAETPDQGMIALAQQSLAQLQAA